MRGLVLETVGGNAYEFTDENNTNWLWLETAAGAFSAVSLRRMYIMPMGEGAMLVVTENTTRH